MYSYVLQLELQFGNLNNQNMVRVYIVGRTMFTNISSQWFKVFILKKCMSYMYLNMSTRILYRLYESSSTETVPWGENQNIS